MGSQPRLKSSVFISSRRQLEESGLLDAMREVCDDINKKAGTLVVDSHAYLPPQPIVCAYIVADRSTDYVMQISLRNSGPALIFLMRRWRLDSSFNFIKWILELLRIPLRPHILLERNLQVQEVTRGDVERWFGYLVSRFKRKFAPA